MSDNDARDAVAQLQQEVAELRTELDVLRRNCAEKFSDIFLERERGRDHRRIDRRVAGAQDGAEDQFVRNFHQGVESEGQSVLHQR